jgi:hypothetical protein
MGGTCSTHGRNVLVGKSEGKRPCRRLKRRWEDHIAVDAKGTGWELVDWIRLVQGSPNYGPRATSGPRKNRSSLT